MKNLVIIVHYGIQQTLADTLRAINEVNGFTFTQVEGHSHYSENDPLLSARDKVEGYVPRVRVDVLLDSNAVEKVLALLKEQKSLHGQGTYWVTEVEKHGRL